VEEVSISVAGDPYEGAREIREKVAECKIRKRREDEDISWQGDCAQK